MNEDRVSGWALVAGSAGVIITLVLHPSGRGLFDPSQFEAAARILVAVHSIGLASLPVWFIGAYGLSRRLDDVAPEAAAPRLGLYGMILYGLALIAMMVAITFDGLVTPGIASRIVQTSGDQQAQMWKTILRYNGFVDEAFVNLFIAGSSVAIALWSLKMLRTRILSRGLGIAGVLLAVLTLGVQFSGLLARFFHIFGMVLVVQAAWLTSAGVMLLKTRNYHQGASTQ
ncbi:MAG TPA: hypothetical protein VH437_19970 [Terriglobales bacterium]|jgi:hypothetical protein